MVKSLISNPPFNIVWQYPLLAKEMPAYKKHPMPPESNANYAFILNGLAMVDNRAAYIMPKGVLTTANKQEAEIRKVLIEQNLLAAVISLPGKMFESTDIPTCVLLFDKQKKTRDVWFFDLCEACTEEVRDQRGQYGGKSHTARTYHKTVKVIPDTVINTVVAACNGDTNNCEYGLRVSLEDIRVNDYMLSPSRYVAIQEKEATHRTYDDILSDLADVIRRRNSVKVTINETAARNIGWRDLVENCKRSKETQTSMLAPFRGLAAVEIEKEDYLATSKNAVIKIETRDTTEIPQAVREALKLWALAVERLNKDENILLAELRDATAADLFSGKLEIDDKGALVQPVK